MGASAIRQSLEGSGLRCTPQRHVVMAFLMECDRHPTAADIFEAVNRRDPRSSRATTYNNLRDLMQAGLPAITQHLEETLWFRKELS